MQRADQVFGRRRSVCCRRFEVVRASDKHPAERRPTARREELGRLGDAIANGGVAPIPFDEIVETSAVALHVEDLLFGRVPSDN
jgi:hypothetical protein